MKGIIISIIAFGFFGIVYGMDVEKIDKITALQVRYETVPPIILIQDNIFKRTGSAPATATVVGKTHQDVINGFCLMSSPVEGDVLKSPNNGASLMTPLLEKYCYYTFRLPNEPTSIILEGVKLDLTEKSACSQKDIEPIPGMLFFVIEPMVSSLYYDNKSCSYETFRRKENIKEPVKQNFYQEKAFEEAEKGLALCYINSLNQIYQAFRENDKDRSIAFAPLSILLGMPKDRAVGIAVGMVLDFISNNTDKVTYSEIQFVVHRDEDFKCYKELLDACMKVFKK